MDLINFFVSHGLSQDTIFLLLILPFLSFLVALARQILGLKSFGMYEPILIALALFIISPDFLTGLRLGVPVIFIAWVVGEISRRLLKGTRLHYMAKVSLKISFASLLILGVLSLMAYLNLSGVFMVNPLSIIIILALVESVSLFQVKRGDTYTNVLSLETLILAIFSYFVLSSPIIKDFLLSHSYFVFIPILGNLIVGRWTGFRLSEYLRFKNVLRND